MPVSGGQPSGATRRPFSAASLWSLTALVLALIAAPTPCPAGLLSVSTTHNLETVSRYDVFEITFSLPEEAALGNPFRDVDVAVHFTGPGGRQVAVRGFYYFRNLWKARLAPDRPGRWTYSYTIQVRGTAAASGRGAFTCIRGDNLGFVRQSPTNPFRWVFDDGTPYWPIGLQDCVGLASPEGTIFDSWALDGGDRNDPWVSSGSDADHYFSAYSQAGFNLFRFSQQNCSYSLYENLDRYLAQEAAWTDELLERLRTYDFRIFYGFIGYGPAHITRPDNAEAMEEVKRFLKYSVDRWGAYVDFWELLNEQEAVPEWSTMMAEYVRSIDPYHHPITDWLAEKLPAIDFNSPHWYERELEESSDPITANNAAEWKSLGKPVIVGEQGNDQNNWDYHSARRMRFRCWSALFNEIAFVFWNTSYALNGHYMNIYLGPEERQYVRALQTFTSYLDNDMKMITVTRSGTQFRAYGLASDKRAAVYLRNRFGKSLQGSTITLTVPQTGHAYWLDPADLRLLGAFSVEAGEQTIPIPHFRLDLALLVTPEAKPAGPPTPVVDANPRFGLAPQTVTFDGRNSVGAFGRSIASYQWTFGDGAADSGPTPSHTYQPGNYLATLQVTDQDGASASASLIVHVATTLRQSRPPVGTLEADRTSGPAPLSVRLRAVVSDAGTAPRCMWSFGDGATAEGVAVEHTYDKPGAYQVTLTLETEHGRAPLGSAIITVGSPAP